MAVRIFALGLWVFASIPLGLVLGWACGLNKLSPRGREVEPGECGSDLRETEPRTGSPHQLRPKRLPNSYQTGLYSLVRGGRRQEYIGGFPNKNGPALDRTA